MKAGLSNDLFSQNDRTIAIHKATQTAIVIRNPIWINAELHYDCLVPQKDEKDKIIFCHATYNENEIITTQMKV